MFRLNGPLQVGAVNTDTGELNPMTITPSGALVVTGGGGTGSGGDVNLTQVAGVAVKTGNGTATGAQRVAIASDNTAFPVNAVQSGPWQVSGTGTFDFNLSEVNGAAVAVGNGSATGAQRVAVASDSVVSSTNGITAVSFGANPAEVASGARSNAYGTIAGIPWGLSGHPNIITRRDTYTGAQTDTAIVTTATGAKLVIVACTVIAASGNTAAPAVRVGFGGTNTPTAAGVYLSHPGIPQGGGVREAGAVAGADGEDIRITCGAPSGTLDVVTKYFSIGS